MGLSKSTLFSRISFCPHWWDWIFELLLSGLQNTVLRMKWICFHSYIRAIQEIIHRFEKKNSVHIKINLLFRKHLDFDFKTGMFLRHHAINCRFREWLHGRASPVNRASRLNGLARLLYKLYVYPTLRLHDSDRASPACRAKNSHVIAFIPPNRARLLWRICVSFYIFHVQTNMAEKSLSKRKFNTNTKDKPSSPKQKNSNGT